MQHWHDVPNTVTYPHTISIMYFICYTFANPPPPGALDYRARVRVGCLLVNDVIWTKRGGRFYGSSLSAPTTKSLASLSRWSRTCDPMTPLSRLNLVFIIIFFFFFFFLAFLQLNLTQRNIQNQSVSEKKKTNQISQNYMRDNSK